MPLVSHANGDYAPRHLPATRTPIGDNVAMASAAIQDQPVELLRRLLRFDTSNPPGGERECIEWIKGLLEELGCEVRMFAHDPERPNLIARLQGAAPARRCCCKATSTWSPRAASGSTSLSPATWPTATCGDAARWT